ncbi:MAG: hypothetical protein HYZ60_01450, partial [Methylocystis sp.]|nr:hypothetical protein [Methylocystis sp.]
MRARSIILFAGLLGVLFSTAVTAESAAQPVAEIFGKKIFAADLTVPHEPAADPARAERARGEALRDQVWVAIFRDYARTHDVAPSEAEIVSHIESNRRMKAESDAEREPQRQALIAELASPGLSEQRRKQAQMHLDALDKVAEFERRRADELRDPNLRKMQEQAERRVAEQWVRRWKLDQALHREFGGRVIFQQAGWEPIDAYRKLLDRYEASKSFVVYDAKLREAVYGYFEHGFVYADEARARFYFEKPYWERTVAEMRA